MAAEEIDCEGHTPFARNDRCIQPLSNWVEYDQN